MKRMRLLGVFALMLLLVSCNDYGEKVSEGKAEVYYKDGATKDDAQRLMDYLFDIGYFDKDQESSVQITKSGKSYIVKLVTKPEYIKKEELYPEYQNLRMSMSIKVFDNAPTELHLCDDQLKTKKKFTEEK